MKDNNIFILPGSALEGRLDPSYYRKDRLDFFQKIVKLRDIVKLKDIIKTGSYGILPPGDSYDESLPVKFLRATELKADLKIDFGSVKKVEDKYLLSKRARLVDNDILIAVKGATIASNKCVAFVEKAPKKSILNGSIFRMQVKENTSPKFIAYMLDLEMSKKQMKMNLVANNAVDYLDKPLLRNLNIYHPSIEQQKSIVKEFDSAFALKDKKITESKELLNSINDYLLNELEIDLPDISDEKYKSKVNIIESNSFDSLRLDPFYYKRVFLDLDNALDSGKYGQIRLRKLYKRLLNGFDNRDYSDKGKKYLRVSNIKSNFVDLKNIKYIPNVVIKKNIHLEVGDVLLTRKGSYGRAVVVDETLTDAVISSEIFLIVIKDKDQLIPEYLASYLNSSIGQLYFERIKTGAIMGHIGQDVLGSLLIALPPIDIQKRICSKISEIRSASNKLNKEAIEVVESVKLKLEKFIWSNK